ncbi:MAG: hypothetical protein K6G73_00855 [Marinilabiliaceae bacterium]|nr:hypothetical protein [Marinilabiliaceae bacterium]
MKINKKIALAALGVVLGATALVGANENIRKAISMTLDDVEAQGGYCVIEISKITHWSNGAVKSEVTAQMHCDGLDDDPCGQSPQPYRAVRDFIAASGCTGSMHNGI